MKIVTKSHKSLKIVTEFKFVGDIIKIINKKEKQFNLQLHSNFIY